MNQKQDAAALKERENGKPVWSAPLDFVRRKSGVLSGALNEPLLHFAVIGFLIFLIAGHFDARRSRYTIDLDGTEIARLSSSFSSQYGSSPTQSQLKALVDQKLREEVLYREGKALGLNTDDQIVRRRIAQKFEFLKIAADAREPTDANLKAWFEAHAASYATPEKRSFEHIYVAIDQRGEESARALAQKAAAKVLSGLAADKADVFPGPSVIRLLSRDDVQRLFGGDRFAEHVFAAPNNQWTQPVRSGFGWHVVRVTEIAPASTPALADIRDKVRIDWVAADKRAQEMARYQEILSRYQIRRADEP